MRARTVNGPAVIPATQSCTTTITPWRRRRRTASETETRGERKERTRRAILDAALALAADSNLAALSLRQVAKEVGIVPTAFYRHFESLELLGLALVDESFVSLRAMLRDVRRHAPAYRDFIDGSLPIVADHVRGQPLPLRLHRPRAGRRAAARPRGDPATRSSCSSASSPPTSPAPAPPSSGPPQDIGLLSDLIVSFVVTMAERLVEDPDSEAAHPRPRPAPSCGWCWSARSTGARASRRTASG